MSGTNTWRSLGTRGRHIEIAEYDPAWPRAFACEAEAILGACRTWVTTIHHVGSTSVPGLAAKPILDIVPVAASPAMCAESISGMTELGYRSRGENGIPGRFYFDKVVEGRTVVHAHMFPEGHTDVRNHLVFRDYLRTHPDAAREYEELKRKLASKHRDNRKAYTEAKAEFINETLSAAGGDHFAGP